MLFAHVASETPACDRLLAGLALRRLAQSVQSDSLQISESIGVEDLVNDVPGGVNPLDLPLAHRGWYFLHSSQPWYFLQSHMLILR